MGASLLGRRFTSNGEDIFIADIAVRQSHFLGGEVTRHPVESGAQISDHVICDPDRLTLEMEVSNFPACSNGQDQGFTETSNRIAGAYEKLRKIRCEKRVFDVQTKLALYRNMVIETIDVSQDADSCNVLRFAANLVSVNIVGSETTALDRVAQEDLRGPINRGDVSTKTVSICDTFVVNPSAFEEGGICECEDLTDFVQREACLRAKGVNTNGVISAGDL